MTRDVHRIGNLGGYKNLRSRHRRALFAIRDIELRHHRSKSFVDSFDHVSSSAATSMEVKVPGRFFALFFGFFPHVRCRHHWMVQVSHPSRNTTAIDDFARGTSWIVQKTFISMTSTAVRSSSSSSSTTYHAIASPWTIVFACCCLACAVQAKRENSTTNATTTTAMPRDDEVYENHPICDFIDRSMAGEMTKFDTLLLVSLGVLGMEGANLLSMYSGGT